MNRIALFACVATLAGSMAWGATDSKPNARESKADTPSPHIVCKDGTRSEAEHMRGACSGHGGVDKKASEDVASASGRDDRSTRTLGAGAARVWGNDLSKVYHCPGDRYYGKTKKGEYMTEAEAKSKGFHPDHGKACADMR